MNPRYSPDVAAKVVLQAAKWVGLTEVRNNAEWDDLSTSHKDTLAAEFKGELLRVGWQSGWPYCAAFCEAVWRRAYQGRAEVGDVSTMLTPGCLVSYANATKLGWTSTTPYVGSIGIMRLGESSKGHAFIVTGLKGLRMATIEANTSPEAGSPMEDREGDGVYAKHRTLVFKPTPGLHLIGFINPCVYV